MIVSIVVSSSSLSTYLYCMLQKRTDELFQEFILKNYSNKVVANDQRLQEACKKVVKTTEIQIRVSLTH